MAFNFLSVALKISEESPFYPREKIVEKQKFYQNVHKHTYLKGRFDKITLAVISAALFMIVIQKNIKN
ncbi:hypothetical protein H5410_035566 [Solanum commersonii]|uniref:Uncharacterized protein n=1 Tax=Solanum commersonii TaxID=4109 RepID=A0A9J5Y5I9_SOLCO|nr:hypothetical protein H5410_035566 [Solanum commersonii]